MWGRAGPPEGRVRRVLDAGCLRGGDRSSGLVEGAEEWKERASEQPKVRLDGSEVRGRLDRADAVPTVDRVEWDRTQPDVERG